MVAARELRGFAGKQENPVPHQILGWVRLFFLAPASPRLYLSLCTLLISVGRDHSPDRAYMENASAEAGLLDGLAHIVAAHLHFNAHFRQARAHALGDPVA